MTNNIKKQVSADLDNVSETETVIMTNADLLAGMTYRQIMDNIYPIGRVIMTFESEDPNMLYSWQSWERTANGRFLLGASNNYSVGSMGGEAEHTLTINEMPSHAHTHAGFPQSETYTWAAPNQRISYVYTADNPYPSNVESSYAGNHQPHNNMPPYLVVNMWKRTA